MNRVKIIVNDRMQKGHYFLSEKEGHNFDPIKSKIT